MNHSDFLTLCRAQPFRPFRVHTHDNQSFDIAAASQVGTSPGERMFVVVLSDARFELLVPERIARCEVLTEGIAPAPPIEPPTTTDSEPKQSPGGITFIAFTATDGRGLVQFAATDADGNPMLSSAGTRWDVYAMEEFENGRTLYVQHADDLTLSRRIILWPPRRGTFESFAEAMDVPDLQRDLEAQGATAKSQGFGVPKSYFKSIVPPEPYVPPMPKLPHPKTGMRADDPNRFAMSAKRYLSAPGESAIGPALTDIFVDRVMFDLIESGWDAKIEDDVAKWGLTLRCATAPGRELKLEIDAFPGLARITGPRGETASLPLEAAERHLRNFPLHNSWDALIKRLAGEPRDLSQPEVVFGSEDGARLEFWPAKADIPAPFLTIRITDSTGRTVLDGRGSQWGALARVFDHGIVLSLMHAEVKDRLSFQPRLKLNLSSHRVTSDAIEGSTCLSVLQKALHTCRTPEWMLEELTEWFGKGKDIPVP